MSDNDADWLVAVLNDLRTVFEDKKMYLASHAIQKVIEATEREIHAKARGERLM